jgi:hypothetical protein
MSFYFSLTMLLKQASVISFSHWGPFAYYKTCQLVKVLKNKKKITGVEKT